MTTTPRVAFWLIPGAADHGWLSVRIAGLAARHGGPVFEPHTTLHVGPVAAGCDVDLLLAAFAARWPPIELEAGPTGQSDVYFKALFSELRADRQDGPILAAMQQAIASACLSDETGEHVPEAIRDALAGYPLQPDLGLLDTTMPQESGVRSAQRLKAVHPGIKVLFLTMHEDEALLHEALRTGAAGYVIKRAEEMEILQAIHAAMRGDIYVHPAMTRALLHQPVTSEHRRGAPANPLTRREIDVLRLLARGNTNRQIANLLELSMRTVENHRANLMGKLGPASRVELVNFAEEHKLL